jgi:serine/threonine protein kinase
MLSSKDSKLAVVKIVDMGNAHILDDDHTSSKSDHRQQFTARSPSYCPPEVLQELRDNAKEDGYAKIESSFDMWSLGVVIYIMLVGECLYYIAVVLSCFGNLEI